MSKHINTIPSIVFLSELYKNLKNYYLPQKNKIPIFNLSQKILDNICEFIEDYSNKKLSIERVDPTITQRYNNIYYSDGIYTITGQPLRDDLYNPNIISSWKEIFYNGILFYLYNYNLYNTMSYLDKDEIKDLKYINTQDKGNLEQIDTVNNEIKIEDTSKNKKENIFIKIKNLFKK